MEIEGIKLGEKLTEGKTKTVYVIPDTKGQVLLQSKDRITAGDGDRAHEMKGKAAISTATTAAIFELLNNAGGGLVVRKCRVSYVTGASQLILAYSWARPAVLVAGIKTHFIKRHGETCFIAHNCDMIPIEWVTRRVATGSFLKRNPGVKEGYKFCPPKQETFYKDDAAHDPQWSYEQCVAAQLKCGEVLIGPDELDIMSKTTVAVFEILEKCWASLDCTLIDMKIEFGVDVVSGELLVADVIDSDSWRLWPAGDRRLMKDKQVYRELKEVTTEALDTVKRNFEWVAERVTQLSPKPHARVVVIMGSPSDMSHCEKIKVACKSYGVPCELRVSSAHKGTDETMKILAQYEGEGIPTVFIAVAGRSNGLGPVLSGNATWPVINCPPITADWGTEDIWSSLRLPSGLGCSTVTSPDGAALCATQILSLSDHVIWSKLRAKQLNTWIGLVQADKKYRDDK